MASPQTCGRHRGRVCTHPSSLVDDGGGAAEGLMGHRRPREHGEEETNAINAMSPLFASGRAVASVGEEAAGGRGVQGVATMR